MTTLNCSIRCGLRGNCVASSSMFAGKPKTRPRSRSNPDGAFPATTSPGQYLGIGVRVGGRWHWRSYSLTSIPRRDKKLISITVKATPEGFLSSHLVNGVEPGTVVRLAAPRGDFALPESGAGQVAVRDCGQRHHSGDGDVALAQAAWRESDIVHVHSAHAAGDVIFHDELCALGHTQPDYRLHLQLTADMGKVDFAALDGLVPDWKDRSTWACGPPAMLDTVEKVWTEAGMRDKLHTERFTIARTDKGGEGGTVTFQISDKSIKLDGATTLMEGGEKLGIQMPFGCRMGICQSCVLPLESGYVRDLRSGTEHRAGDRIQTCISAASGDCTIDI